MSVLERVNSSVRSFPLEYSAALLAVAAVITAGFALLSAGAAGPYAFADASAATVSGGATVAADSAAVNGKAVKFAAPTPTDPNPPTTSNGPRGKGLYRDLRLQNDGRPAAISGQPYAVWIGGWSGDPAATAKKHVDAAASQGKIATFVLYNIPLRDCGLYSAGGLKDFNEYKNWINGVVTGIGQREAIVIVEPDALAGIDCLNATQKTDRLNGLKDTVTALTTKTKSYVYLEVMSAGYLPLKWPTA